ARCAAATDRAAAEPRGTAAAAERAGTSTDGAAAERATTADVSPGGAAGRTRASGRAAAAGASRAAAGVAQALSWGRFQLAQLVAWKSAQSHSREGRFQIAQLAASNRAKSRVAALQLDTSVRYSDIKLSKLKPSPTTSRSRGLARHKLSTLKPSPA